MFIFPIALYLIIIFECTTIVLLPSSLPPNSDLGGGLCSKLPPAPFILLRLTCSMRRMLLYPKTASIRTTFRNGRACCFLPGERLPPSHWSSNRKCPFRLRRSCAYLRHTYLYQVHDIVGIYVGSSTWKLVPVKPLADLTHNPVEFKKSALVRRHVEMEHSIQ